MAKLIQISASANDLFGLDGDGVTYHYNFNTNSWVRLGCCQRDHVASPAERPVVKRRDESDRGSLAGVRGIAMLTVLCLAFGIAAADVPTAEDKAKCNLAAAEGVRDPSIAPTQKDEAGADGARQAQGATVAHPSGRTGAVMPSPDPQVNGIDPEGAKDARYRAAYRICMRRSGF